MAQPAKSIFRVRLNCVDHYQGNFTNLDSPVFGPHTWNSATQRGRLPQVPVIRVFGATETGQKVCVHIHGAFPYLYLPYEPFTSPSSSNSGSDNPTKSPPGPGTEVESDISTLRNAIDHALALSYRRNPFGPVRESTFVAHISLVKGVPFFGYNVGYRYFLKVSLLNPGHMTRLADLLYQGAIMHRIWQPYEAHLQFLLQWMCDFNLYGCAYIETDRPRFRAPLPSFEDVEAHGDEQTRPWHDRSVSSDWIINREDDIMGAASFPRQSHCELELDIRVEDILNRHEIQPRPLHHSFMERLSGLDHDQLSDEKFVHSMAGLWRDETRRRKLRLGLTDPSSSPFPPEVLVSMSADPRNTDDGGWVHEQEFRQLINTLVEQEKKGRGPGDPILTFDTFGASQFLNTNDGVRTVFESVTDLFQTELQKKWDARAKMTPAANADEYDLEGLSQGFENFLATQRESGSDVRPLVDVENIALSDDQDEYGSDEEAAKQLFFTQRQKNITAVSHERPEESDQDNAGEDATISHAPASTQSGAAKRGTIRASQGPFKRPKVGGSNEGHGGNPTAPQHSLRKTITIAGRNAQSESERDELSKPSSQTPPSSQLFQQGIKSGFPIVKDAQTHSTALRLSQGDSPEKYSRNNTLAATSKAQRPLTNSTSSMTSGLSTRSSGPTGLPSQQKLDPKVALYYLKTFEKPADTNGFLFGALPPSFDDVETTLTPAVLYQDAYYSSEKDVPERPKEYAGKEFKLESLTVPFLPVFDSGRSSDRTINLPSDKAPTALGAERRRRQCKLRSWEILAPPPSFDLVQNWLNAEQKSKWSGNLVQTSPVKSKRSARGLSQIDGPTQKHKHGSKYTQHKKTSVQHQTGYMSTMSLEVHVNSRDDLAPDPEQDEVNLIVWCIADEQMQDAMETGILVLGDEFSDHVKRIQQIAGPDVTVDAEEDELDLINRMVDIVRQHDPDILTGYEVHNGSWGYLIERARLRYEFNLPDEFSRMKSQSHGRYGKDADRWGFNVTSSVRITGRHTINIWRAMRSELNLLQYTMENVVFHILHRRIPHYSFATLTKWYQQHEQRGRVRDLAKLLDYFITRTKLDLEILNASELIPRTSEQARLLGVDFFSVFSRGSQFKVESLMFRIAKPESFILVSPSRKQVGAQNALECLPLVMEPQSAFYPSPLLVLDFQSLYPSVMIAYNYCYSTCLGRVTNWRGANKLGFANFARAPGLLELVSEKLNIAPNGMMYVKPEMRKSLLAKMLGEILETRVMVKSGMKVDKDDRQLQKLLNNRQLALKLIANVTYGYTSASFSGRMPCSEIADSIVQTGRSTLEKAIALIHSVSRWGAEVVYGDTDSLFVYLPGRSRREAFTIGDEIAAAVTNANPRPIKLKFEKVYHPCVLLAKKRYVGYKYESPSQTTPEFDAKGIETVRRDGTPAEQKIEEKALHLLFRTADLTQIKAYFQSQCAKIMQGRVSVQDFCFAKEVKLGTYAERGPPPPGALIATRKMLHDPRAEPQYGERVPYVVIAGAPGARLWERCVEPERLLRDFDKELDAEYYISKNIIPPLERIFGLVGANVRAWWDEMPKTRRVRMLAPGSGSVGQAMENNLSNTTTTTTSNAKILRRTMESYMNSSQCLVCHQRLPARPPPNLHSHLPLLPLCHSCRHTDLQNTLLTLRARLTKLVRVSRDLQSVCRDCAAAGLPLPVTNANASALGSTRAPRATACWGFDEQIPCDSKDCPVFWSRTKADAKRDVEGERIRDVVHVLEQEACEGWEW